MKSKYACIPRGNIYHIHMYILKSMKFAKLKVYKRFKTSEKVIIVEVILLQNITSFFLNEQDKIILIREINRKRIEH